MWVEKPPQSEGLRENSRRGSIHVDIIDEVVEQPLPVGTYILSQEELTRQIIKEQAAESERLRREAISAERQARIEELRAKNRVLGYAKEVMERQGWARGSLGSAYAGYCILGAVHAAHESTYGYSDRLNRKEDDIARRYFGKGFFGTRLLTGYNDFLGSRWWATSRLTKEMQTNERQLRKLERKEARDASRT